MSDNYMDYSCIREVAGHQALFVKTDDKFDEDSCRASTETIKVANKSIDIVKWGRDNLYPNKLIKTIGNDEVLAPNKLTNVLTCYGSGILYKDLSTNEKSVNKDVVRFVRRNYLPKLWLEQITDMKYFYFFVVVFILSKDGTKIVQMRHKEASHIRFAKSKNGVIPCVYSANWDSDKLNEVEEIALLNEHDPIGDLMVRMGREANDLGQFNNPKPTDRKFAMVVKFPTPGNRYYPNPYYTAFLRGDWFDIKRLIGLAKKHKIKNSSSVKFLVEIHKNHWQNIFTHENITDEEKKKERVKREYENIETFISGAENGGKMWISEYYQDAAGNDVKSVRITNLNIGKEGGDWSEDIAEANNVACYADGVHPNLFGATPGKSGMNNSGSDKRELFTMKQFLEQPFHDIMLLPHYLVAEFNNWDVEITVPMITLTTLDKNSDAEKIDTQQLKDTNE